MSATKQFLILIVTATCMFIGLFWLANSTATTNTATVLGVRSVLPTDFLSGLHQVPDRQLIDIRTPEEYEAGHLSGAVNLNFYHPLFTQRLSELDRDAPIAIYCRSGSRTSKTLAVMQEMGFTDVIELQGGVLAWQEHFDEDVCPGRIC